jgi:hypothetical protein
MRVTELAISRKQTPALFAARVALKPKGSFGSPPSGRLTRPVPVNSSPEGVLDKSLEDVEGDVNTGMP